MNMVLNQKFRDCRKIIIEEIVKRAFIANCRKKSLFHNILKYVFINPIFLFT